MSVFTLEEVISWHSIVARHRRIILAMVWLHATSMLDIVQEASRNSCDASLIWQDFIILGDHHLTAHFAGAVRTGACWSSSNIHWVLSLWVDFLRSIFFIQSRTNNFRARFFRQYRQIETNMGLIKRWTLNRMLLSASMSDKLVLLKAKLVW